MSWWTRLWARDQLSAELDAELRDHLERKVADAVRSGVPEAEAYRNAHVAFGGMDQTKEMCRDVGRLGLIQNLIRDIPLALRGLWRTPIVTVVAVLSLALAIGANTAIFSIVNSLYLRTLPTKDPRRLVLLTDVNGPRIQSWTYAVWEQIEQRPTLFDGAVAWSFTRFNRAVGGETQLIDGLWVSGSFFDVLGVPARLGRTFDEADNRRGGGTNPVAVISDRFWQTHWGGTSRAIGGILTLDGVPFTIIGITPPNFLGPEVGRTFDVIVPFGTEPLIRGHESWLDRRAWSWLTIMARLAPHQTLQTATDSVRAVQPSIRAAALPEQGAKQSLERYLTTPFALIPAGSGPSSLRDRLLRPVLVVMIVVVLVLLIACANIANLLLARGSARRHELAVRVALGASRWRLAQQLFTESAVLATTATTCGLLLAWWGRRVLINLLSTDTTTVVLDLSLDAHLLVYAMALAIGTTVLCGVIPALSTSTVSPMDALKGRGPSVPGPARFGLVSVPVVAQVALSLVLVVAAGLFGRTLWSLVHLPLGFERDHVLVVQMNPARATDRPGQRLPLYARVQQAVSALPGVADAAVSLTTPTDGITLSAFVEVSGGSPMPQTERLVLDNVISPGWFRTFGTPLMAGRDFVDRDTKETPPVAIVNQAFARKFLNGTSPLGHTITLVVPPGGPPAEIVGVSADAVYRSLRDQAPATIYRPLAQQKKDDDPAFMVPTASLSVRSVSAAGPLTKSIAAAIAAINPQLALTFRSLTAQIDGSLGQERLVALLAGWFSGVALILSGLGLYGVTSYGVARRRAELGIRMVLGATPSGVLGLVLCRVAILVGIGVVLGAGISLLTSRFIASLLYGLEPRDFSTLAGAALVLSTVALLAAAWPAYRASRLDPAAVLRPE